MALWSYCEADLSSTTIMKVIKAIGQFTDGTVKWHTPAYSLNCYLGTQKT